MIWLVGFAVALLALIVLQLELIGKGLERLRGTVAAASDLNVEALNRVEQTLDRIEGVTDQFDRAKNMAESEVR